VQLIPQRLRGLREEKGLTQFDIGEALAKRLGRPLTSSSQTLTNGYQRIETSGRTSPKKAVALAELYGVSLAVLEGKDSPEPADYEASIYTMLTEQLEQGENPALQRALEREVENGPEDAIKWLAHDICQRIEIAQLARNPNELDRLSELTGLPSNKILEPANVKGHWLVTVSARDCFRTSIVLGTIGVVGLVREVVGDRLDHWGSDGVIRIRRDGCWYRLEIEQQIVKYLMRIDFVRCQPNADGLRWLQPSWWEQLRLDAQLGDWANATSNFVAGLDGAQSPTDVTKLRLLVTEFEGTPPSDTKHTVILSEIPDRTMASFAREASTHEITLSWLGVELQDFLGLRLKEYPQRCWSISEHDGAIDIQFWPPPTARDMPYGLRYRIQLAEEVAPNQFSNVPWRSKDRATLKNRIETWLN
jgi:transcriptional regulator with XRE-family HTH domain